MGFSRASWCVMLMYAHSQAAAQTGRQEAVARKPSRALLTSPAPSTPLSHAQSNSFTAPIADWHATCHFKLLDLKSGSGELICANRASTLAGSTFCSILCGDFNLFRSGMHSRTHCSKNESPPSSRTTWKKQFAYR